MSTSSFLTSVASSFILCAAYTLFFCILRKRLRTVYEPRTFVVTSSMRVPETSSGFISWLPATLKTPANTILTSSGLDAYFFLRYICFVMALCIFLGTPLLCVLLPIHLSGNREGIHGLETWSAVNIGDTQSIKHVAHLIFCIVFTTSFMLIFKFELTRYFHIRTQHIIDGYDDTPGPRSTILIKDLHESYRTETDIKAFFAGLVSQYPGNVVKKVWFNRNYSELHSLVLKRRKVLDKLELNELWLVKNCLNIGNSENAPSNGNKDAVICGNLWREYLDAEGFSAMNGQRGAKFSWLKAELCQLNAEILQIQTHDESIPLVNSCFVQFDSELSAFIASRSIGLDKCLSIGKEVYDRVHPADIIWSNLGAHSWVSKVRAGVATLLNYVLIFGWAIPVTLISITIQSDTVADALPTIQWLIQAPKLSTIMTGMATPLIVATLTSQIPTVFRFLAHLKGYPTCMRIEMDVQKYLFLFMFFQLFLIVTLSTGLPGLMVQVLLNTSEGAITLANSLSESSTFFISYLTANSLTTAGNTLLQTQQLLVTAYHSWYERTPRQVLENKCRSSSINWGSVFPLVTHVGAIAIAYALISPVIMVSAIIGLGALHVAFKYRILYCNVPSQAAYGDYYPKAIFQLFTGIYCQQVSLLGTLLLSRQLILGIFIAMLVVFTAICQHHLNHLYLDLSTRIPLKQKPHDMEDRLTGQHNGKLLSSSYAGTLPTHRASTRCKGSLPHEMTARTSPHEHGLNATPAWESCQNMFAPLMMPIPIDNVNGQQSADEIGHSWEIGRSNLHQVDSPGSSTSHQALNEAWKGIFDSVAADLSSLTPDQRAHISGQLFEHPDKRLSRPCVWIPRDWKGVAHDQVLEMQSMFTDLRSSCNGAHINCQGEIIITQLPPDFDPLKIIKI